jgi:hypothetical protein
MFITLIHSVLLTAQRQNCRNRNYLFLLIFILLRLRDVGVAGPNPVTPTTYDKPVDNTSAELPTCPLAVRTKDLGKLLGVEFVTPYLPLAQSSTPLEGSHRVVT